MTHRGDLNAALQFVNRRIEEEAARSGEALSGEERFLLKNLPSISVFPQPYVAGLDSPLLPLPRDRVYERLCKLAKAAYQHDLRLNSTSAREWQYAAAVTKVNRHSVFWLLEWAGVKERSRSTDRWLLWASGVIVVVVMIPLMLLVASKERPKPLQAAELMIAFLALMVLLQLASRLIMNRQLMRTIDRADDPHFLSR